MDDDLTPVEGCTRCGCGAKYWKLVWAVSSHFACASCGATYHPWDYELDEGGIPQLKG